MPVQTTLVIESQRWLEAISADHDRTTVAQYGMYLRTHFGRFFACLDNVTTPRMAEYFRARLRLVKRDTVSKERSGLSSLLGWAHEQGLIAEVPEIPQLPRRATGTPDTSRPHKSEIVCLTEEEARALIDRLPERSLRRGCRGGGFVVRARFCVAYLTGLRPATLDEIEFPRDYRRGSAVLRIRDEVDKNRFGRDLPLCDEARATLDEVCPEVGSGLIFGRHDYRIYLARAARDVLPPEKAKAFSQYDLRHSRLTLWCERSTNLVGVAYLSGHRRVDTLASRYVHPHRSAADEVLRSTKRQLTFDDLLDPTRTGK